METRDSCVAIRILGWRIENSKMVVYVRYRKEASTRIDARLKEIVTQEYPEICIIRLHLYHSRVDEDHMMDPISY